MYTLTSIAACLADKVSTQGDKHTIHDDRRATCHCRMRTLHPKKTGVTQIARSDLMEIISRFPVALIMITNMDAQNS